MTIFGSRHAWYNLFMNELKICEFFPDYAQLCGTESVHDIFTVTNTPLPPTSTCIFHSILCYSELSMLLPLVTTYAWFITYNFTESLRTVIHMWKMSVSRQSLWKHWSNSMATQEQQYHLMFWNTRTWKQFWEFKAGLFITSIIMLKQVLQLIQACWKKHCQRQGILKWPRTWKWNRVLSFLTSWQTYVYCIPYTDSNFFSKRKEKKRI